MGFGLCGFVCSVVVFEVELTGTSYKFNCVMIDRLTISGVHSKRKQFLVVAKNNVSRRTRSLCFGGGEVSNMFFTFGLYFMSIIGSISKYEISNTVHKSQTSYLFNLWNLNLTIQENSDR